MASQVVLLRTSMYHLCIFEEDKTATLQKGVTWWKICRPGDVFSRKAGEHIDATGSVTEGCVAAHLARSSVHFVGHTCSKNTGGSIRCQYFF